MDIIPDIIYNVVLLFIMMVPGVILKKCGLSADGVGKGISNLVLYVAQPALIFLAYLREFSWELLINSVYVLALSVVAHVIFSFVALSAFRREPDSARRMLRFATVFSNAAFMGIPLISAIFESTFPEATVYASIYNITFNFFLWSLGVYICTDDRDEDGDGVTDGDVLTDYHEVRKKKKSTASPLKALYHPVTIAALLGLVFFIFPIHGVLDDFAGGIIVDSLAMLRGLVAPLSMTVIGLRLADMDFHGVLRDRAMYLFLAFRHFVLPIIVVLVIKILSLGGLQIDRVVSTVVVIMAAAPAASSATMFAEKYDCDAAYVSRLVTISTLLCIFTMPLILTVFDLLLPAL